MVSTPPAAAAQIEYSIYTYDMPRPGQKGESKWQKHVTLDDMIKAMVEAQNLYDSEKFQKIEVKKKFFDQKKNRVVDMTLKVYERDLKKDHSTMIAIIFALICGIGAFAASFLMTNG